MHTLSESASKLILSDAGIPVVEGREVEGAEKAVAAARELGYPVVLKISHPELAHKSDAGGVVLGVTGAEKVHRHCKRLLALRDGAKVRVERQAEPGGIDLICGLKQDPIFGPVVMVGLGGVYAELFKDTALHVGELAENEAAALVRSLAGYPLLAGARGRSSLDVAGVARTLTALAHLGQARTDLVELDINPLRVYRNNVLALDALALAKSTSVEAAQRTRGHARGSVPDEAVVKLASGRATRGHARGSVPDEAVVKLASGRAARGHARGSVPDEAVVERHESHRVHRFFHPRCVAVVGASTTNERAGNIIIKNMRTLGFAGAIYPVNPSGDLVEGLASCRTVAECPRPIDLAVLAVPYTQVEKVLGDVREAGVGHVIVVTGGFSDAGQEGKAREAEMARFCLEHGIHLMGPNSIGTLDSRSGFTTSIGKLPPVPATGVSLMGQSGTLSTGYTLGEVTTQGLGFSKVACLGNKPDVNEIDVLEYLGMDPDTAVIGMYLEAVQDGPRFFAAAREAARRKPVVVVKSGRTATGALAAASHTGALAGEDAVFEAVFRQAGVQRATSLEEMTGLLRAFDMCPLPRGNRIGIVSLTGVGCVLAADACGEYGLELAPLSPPTQARLKELAPDWATITNPADIWSTIEQRGPADSFLQVGEAFFSDENVDMVLLISVLLEEGSFDAGAALEPLVTAWPDKPVLACYAGARRDLEDDFRKGLHAIGVPVFSCVASAVHAAARLFERARFSLCTREPMG